MVIREQSFPYCWNLSLFRWKTDGSTSLRRGILSRDINSSQFAEIGIVMDIAYCTGRLVYFANSENDAEISGTGG
jgi:hypothetical protein